MLEIAHLISLAGAYGAILGIEEKTVSSRVFADSKKIQALRNGSDITVGRFNAAVQWFSDNWPTGAEWPEAVARPEVSAERPVLEAAE